MEGRRSSKMPWAIVLLLVLTVCAVSYGVAALGTRIFGADSMGHCETLTIANLQDLQTTKYGFVYYDGNTVSSISSSGKTQWSYLVGVNAGFTATDYGVAAWSGKTVTLIDLKSGVTTYNGTMDDTILSCRVGDKYTGILIGEEDNGTMVLMENGGKVVNKIILEDVLVIDYGFYSDGSLMWVMVCDTNGTVPTCTVQTYKPNREIVGSISDTQQLIYTVAFQSSQVCAVGDTYLKVYDYTGVEDTDKRRLVYGWYMAARQQNANDPLMAFVTDAQYSGTSDIRDVRLIRSDTDEIVRLPFGCMDVVIAGETVYGFSADGHLMRVTLDKLQPEAYRVNITVDKVYGITQDNVAVLGNGEQIYLVTLA